MQHSSHTTAAVIGLVGVFLANTAHAADLPLKAPPLKANCYATFWSWFNASPADCPLGISAIAFYGTIDVGGSYQTHAAPFNNYYPNGVEALVGRQSGGAAFVASPNNFSQSFIGLKGTVPVFADVKFIYNINAGFDPYSLQFANGPGSLVSQNGIPVSFQQSNGDSSRAGQWYNNYAYAGFTSDTYGSFRAGRQSTFSNDLINSYDPTGGSYAFSLLGNSGTLGGGLGVTEVTRYNTALQYVYDYNHLVHAGVMAQVGSGFSDGNGATNAYQVYLGGAYKDFSIDGLYAHDQNAIALSTFAPALPANYVSTDLKGTYANLDAFQVLAKYKYQQVTFSGGYQNTRFSNPDAADTAWDKTSAVTAQGSGYQVVPTVAGSVNTTAYTINRILQTVWGGFKYSITPNLDLDGGYWHVWQNNYDTAPLTTPGGNCSTGYTISGTGTAGYPKIIGQGTKASDCAGSEDAVSLVLDYKVTKRFDTYIGVMYSKVNGGLASNFAQSNNIATTGGVRLSF